MVETCSLHGSPVRYFGDRWFTVGGRLFEIIGTVSTGRRVIDAVDTVRNDKGERRDFSRIELIKFAEGGI
jgi:hypothetical protein